MVERFRCLRCLHCCFFSRPEESPVVFSWEAARLRELLEDTGADNTEFEPYEVWRRDGLCVVLLYRWVIRGFCPFYDVRSRTCRIHPEKPSSCRIYPLLLAVPTGELRISGACDWVERNMWIVKRGDLVEKVLPGEVAAARRLLADYVAAVQVLEEEGFVKVAGVEGCSEVIGFEEWVEGRGGGGESGEA